MEKEPITVSGLQNLKKELEDLKNVQRPKVVEAIAEARSHGDLKENAEYHAAKEEQSHTEGRITEINDIIARANVIDVTKINNDGKIIHVGVVLENNHIIHASGKVRIDRIDQQGIFNVENRNGIIFIKKDYDKCVLDYIEFCLPRKSTYEAIASSGVPILSTLP